MPEKIIHPVLILSMITHLSASSNFADRINPDGRLRKITGIIVLYPQLNPVEINVYRKSSEAPGRWSCDKYTFDGRALHGPIKDKQKYDYPPLPPSGSHEYPRGDHRLYSEKECDEELINRAFNLLAE